MAEKDMQGPGSGGMDTFNNFDGMHGGRDGRGDMEIPVPRQAVGLVIGKDGEVIKKIQTDTGAMVQFQPDDGQSGDRLCAITGSPDQVQNAISMIHELLANTNNAGPDFPSQFGGGREDPPGGPPDGPMGPGPGSPGPQGPQGPGGFEQFRQYGQPNQPPQQYGAPQGWNAHGNPYQPSGPNAADIQARVANSAGWAAYYHQYYANYSQYGQDAQQHQQPAGQSYAPPDAADVQAENGNAAAWVADYTQYYANYSQYGQYAQQQQQQQQQAQQAPQHQQPQQPADQRFALTVGVSAAFNLHTGQPQPQQAPGGAVVSVFFTLF